MADETQVATPPAEVTTPDVQAEAPRSEATEGTTTAGPTAAEQHAHETADELQHNLDTAGGPEEVADAVEDFAEGGDTNGDVDAQQAALDRINDMKPEELEEAALNGDKAAQDRLTELRGQERQTADEAEEFVRQQAESQNQGEEGTAPKTETDQAAPPPDAEARQTNAETQTGSADTQAEASSEPAPVDTENQADTAPAEPRTETTPDTQAEAAQTDTENTADTEQTQEQQRVIAERKQIMTDVQELARMDININTPEGQALIDRIAQDPKSADAIIAGARAARGEAPRPIVDNRPIIGAVQNPDGTMDYSRAARVEFNTGNPPLQEATPEGVVQEAEQAATEASERQQMLQDVQEIAGMGIDLNSEEGKNILDAIAENPAQAENIKNALKTYAENVDLAGPKGAGAAAEAMSNSMDDEIAAAEASGDTEKFNKLSFLKKFLKILAIALLAVTAVAVAGTTGMAMVGVAGAAAIGKGMKR